MKNPNNGASFFFNTVHLLPNDLQFEHGALNLFLALGTILPRYVLVSHRRFRKNPLSGAFIRVNTFSVITEDS